MKKLLLSCFMISLTFGSVFAQAIIGNNEPVMPVTKEIKNILYQRANKNLRSGLRDIKDTVRSLSHVNYNSAIADQSNAELNDFYAGFFRLSDKKPTDSFSMKYVGILYDDLNGGFGAANATRPFSIDRTNAMLYLDSVNVGCIYARGANVDDTVLIYTFNADNINRNFPLVAPNQLVTSFIKIDTIILKAALPKVGTSPFSVITVPIGAWLPKGKTFGFIVEFKGHVSNQFAVPSFCLARTECGTTQGALSAHTNNSFVYYNSGTSPLMMRTWNTFTPGNLATDATCRHYYFQNLWIDADVIDSTALSCNVSSSQNPGITLTTPETSLNQYDYSGVCKGTNTSLFCSVIGNTSQNVTFEWTPTTDLDDATISNPVSTMYASGANRTYTVKIKSGTDSTVCTKVIASRNMTVVLADKVTPCGTTTSLSPTYTGLTGTNTYQWSSGETTKTLSNKDVGVYKLTVTNALGCSATSTTNVTNPGVSNTLNFTNLGTGIIFCATKENKIVNTSSETAGWSFTWTATGANNSTEQDGKITFPTAGTINVTLSATRTSDMCQALPVTKSVVVKPASDPACKTAISSLNNATKVNIYPIPTSNEINVEINGLEKDGQLIITDVLGNIIDVREVKSNEFINETVTFINQPNGVYFVKLISGNDKTVQKIIVSK